jgi:hypothetical protein
VDINMKKFLFILSFVFSVSNPGVTVQGEWFIPGYGWGTLGGTKDFGPDYYGNRSYIRQGNFPPGVYQYYGNTQYAAPRIRIGPNNIRRVRR